MNEKCSATNWRDAYLIGHEQIDLEHKKLFDLATNILQIKDNPEKLKDAIKTLIKYTKFHFANEENYMKSIHYDNLPAHILLHKTIVDKLNLFIQNLANYTQEEIFEILHKFVTENIIQHILLEDKKVHHFRRDKKELRDIFVWKDDYAIGQQMIDEEHKELFRIAQRALDYKDKDIKEHIKKTIFELYEYMKVHFADEEKYMQEINYPELASHIVLHQKIIEGINLFIKRLSTMKLDDFERKLIEFMDIWLVNHIVYEDKKITCFLEYDEESLDEFLEHYVASS